MHLLKITHKRFEIVYQDISEGSEPAVRFYLMVAVSTLIASFGLISNSTAVVIGAMLVAPLMTPIFGIALALVRGEPVLLGRALRAEIVGVAAAVSMGLVLGLLLGDIEPTAEMLSRTRPTLFDLLVAVLAGFAGAYALVDEKISPALPGVAIATAIVPPLANSGLCLALGEVAGAVGSFLLFVANFLSILVIASLTFIISGMAKRFGARAKRGDLMRRFQLPIVAFVVIAAFLGHSLYAIAKERQIYKKIEQTLIEQTSRIPSTNLENMDFYDEREGKQNLIHVVAKVSTPEILTPNKVSAIQEKLTQQVGMPTELIVHCSLSSSVSASGSLKNTLKQNLDGTFIKSTGSDLVDDIATTEQIIREYVATDVALSLSRVEHIPRNPQRKIMLAHISGFRQLTAEEIRSLENEIQKATQDPTIELVFSHSETMISTVDGLVRYGWIPGKHYSPEIIDRTRNIKQDMAAFINRDQVYTLVNINLTRLDNMLHFLLEIVGPDVYPRERIEPLRALLSEKFSESIALYIWSRIEVVHGPQGSLSMKELDRYLSSRQKENLPDEMQLILEAASR